jgi:hypothetical protein
MKKGQHLIPIWFYLGSHLMIYGILILGAGTMALVRSPKRAVVMSGLHADIWWGLLLLILGTIYCLKFPPTA